MTAWFRGGDRTAHAPRWLVAAFVVLSIATLVQGWVNGAQDDARQVALEERLDRERAEKDLLARRVNESRDQTVDLISQVERLGREPVVSEAELPPKAPPAAGEVTAADIEVAVGDYFQRFPIRVPQVSAGAIQSAVSEYLVTNPPAPGRPPTDREIAEQVVGYLTVNPPPAGPAGEAGEAGADGRDGKDGLAGASGKDGKDGRAITAAKLDGCTLVVDFSDGTSRSMGPICGPEGVAGPPGPTGEPGEPGGVGPPGEPGRGVSSIACDVASEQLLVTYTDGSTEAVAGSDCVARGGPPQIDP